MIQNDVSDCTIETITSSGHTKEMKFDKYLKNLKYKKNSKKEKKLGVRMTPMVEHNAPLLSYVIAQTCV